MKKNQIATNFYIYIYIAQQIQNSVLNWKRKMNIENMEHQIKRKKVK